MTPEHVGVDVEAIDPHDMAAFDDWFAAWRETDLEFWPGGPGWQYAERLAMALDESGPEENRPLVARQTSATGTVTLGIANLKMFRRENLHRADLGVRVLSAHRRRGVGSALVRAAAGIAAATGRTEVAGMDETPVRPGYVDAAGPFARSLGFTVVQRMVRRRLDLPVDLDLRRDPKATPSGYSLLTFVDRWPDDYLEDRCELGRRMSTDVPTGEQEVDKEVWDPERVRALEASLAAQDRAKVTTVARDDVTGRLIAFTEIAIPVGAPESAWQHDTLVMREHRGHGLGFAIKVANVFAVQDRYPAVRWINTWNAEENAPMIAVNEEIGCVVEAYSAHWHRPIGADLLPA